MTMPEYFGTARLLVETHNKYLKMLSLDDTTDDDQSDMMESFVSDFNQISTHYQIKSTDNGAYEIFDT